MFLWIFMFVCDLAIPLIMIGVGRSFITSAPKEINPVFGYRTKMSMKNKDTWNFAHQYCGRIWLKFGWITLALTAATMLLVFRQSEDAVGLVGGVVCGLQVVVIVATLFPTERALKRTFDQNGNRRQ